ncbi:MAG TPA: hypothetical protein PK020_03850 [Ilumatobacteraceae bacterium]|nr:hypothetical protein [Ilumatobacteraceae bacterium]HRB02754.1 hypothetical protein [Ilumatobacteraceae bacterium]
MKNPVGTSRAHAVFAARVSRSAVVIVMVASLAACGKESSSSSSSAVVTQPAPAAGAPAQPAGVPELLQFTAPLVGGGEFDGAQRSGQATAFWFWAPT